MRSQAREWLVLVEHRGPTTLSGACFEYVIIASTELEAENRAREKHNYRGTPYNIVASVESSLPTNVASKEEAQHRETRTRLS